MFRLPGICPFENARLLLTSIIIGVFACDSTFSN